jgi:uncharacterized protein YecE (DUF72 family)
MVRIGTSGWTYKHWKGLFYPDDLPQNRWFEYYTKFFDTVELNATFYRLFPEKTFIGWKEKAPEGFRFAVKLWRWITHRKRLSNVAEDLSTFCRRAEKLEDSLGPVLIQLPPGLKWSSELFINFIECLPRNFLWTIEFRRQEWLNEAFCSMVRQHNIALAYADHPYVEIKPGEAFGPFIYLRFHGAAGDVYAGSYPDDELNAWADRIKNWIDQGKDVWVYFNNDLDGHAVRNAEYLKRQITVL